MGAKANLINLKKQIVLVSKALQKCSCLMQSYKMIVIIAAIEEGIYVA